MIRIFVLLFISSIALISACKYDQSETVDITRTVLLDKIRGGWVGKAYGVSFGGPTEFGYQGKIIEGPLKLDPEGLEWLPWQDDMYVNMALLKAVFDKGLDATAEDFAKELQTQKDSGYTITIKPFDFTIKVYKEAAWVQYKSKWTKIIEENSVTEDLGETFLIISLEKHDDEWKIAYLSAVMSFSCEEEMEATDTE